MTRPRILDAYSCAGGAAMGYHRAGFDVVGVDINPQPNYPFEHHVGDAVEFIREHGAEFDFIHMSPPCQFFVKGLGAANKAMGRAYDHVDLIPASREAAVATGKPYVIENVETARHALIDPVRICGTGFGRPLRRHRWFESNVSIAGNSCDHKSFTEKRYWTGWMPNGERRLATTVQVYGNGGGTHEWPAAMGIEWMSAKEMAEAIPPDYTEHIGRQILGLDALVLPL